MSETVTDEFMWWNIEPPVDDGEEPIVEENIGEYLDGTKSHALFENVAITEHGSGLGFNVPARIIDTPEHSK